MLVGGAALLRRGLLPAGQCKDGESTHADENQAEHERGREQTPFIVCCRPPTETTVAVTMVPTLRAMMVTSSESATVRDS
jgi:septum formation inhibitor-activating ATPase MinD